jgi:hypothetical protein
MFTVTDVRDPFLLWVSVELQAEANMSLTAQRLRPRWWGFLGLRPPALDTRVLQVKAGERFIIDARKADGFWIGERVPLDRVANKRPISRNFRTIATL